MSTIKELSESKITITMNPKENIAQSAVKDLITFSMLAFCIYLSQGSTWWTFITGIICIILLGAKLTALVKSSATTFVDKDAAIKYLADLEI